MYYKRKIDDYLINWKADPMHKPLIVKGGAIIKDRKDYKNYNSFYLYTSKNY